MFTKEDDAVIRTMRDAGHSYTVIAERLGRTRNAVIGRGNRIGVPSNPRPVGKSKRTRQRRAQVSVKVDHDKRRATAQRVNARPKNKLTRMIEAAIPGPDPVGPKGAIDAVMALKPGRCRYPHGDPKGPDFQYCMAPCEGTYCKAHRRVVFWEPKQ
jgi:hypothetical protein